MVHCRFPEPLIVYEGGARRVMFRVQQVLDAYDEWKAGAREYMKTGGGEYT